MNPAVAQVSLRIVTLLLFMSISFSNWEPRLSTIARAEAVPVDREHKQHARKTLLKQALAERDWAHAGARIKSRSLQEQSQAPAADIIVTVLGPDAAPAPGPEFAMSPPHSPFINGSSSDLICCCQGNSASNSYTLPYQSPAPPYCCCGQQSDCCATTTSVMGLICGGGQVCGILMLMSALIGVLVLTICITGAFMARRRRLQAATGETAAAQLQTGLSSRPTLQVPYIPPDQLMLLSVHKPVEEEVGTQKECPICLDAIDVAADNWAAFPCTHGCCKPCLEDLLRHSSRRVNPSVLAVLCPLCRKVAVAPISIVSGTPLPPRSPSLPTPQPSETLITIQPAPQTPAEVELAPMAGRQSIGSADGSAEPSAGEAPPPVAVAGSTSLQTAPDGAAASVAAGDAAGEGEGRHAGGVLGNWGRPQRWL